MHSTTCRRRRFVTAAVVALALHLVATASAVAETPPAVSITRNYAEISVTIDAALKPFAGLSANCLAEAKAWAAKMDAAAGVEWRHNRSAFRDGMQWSYDRDYSLRSIVGRYVSIVRSDGTFEGGAHPNQAIDTILWDAAAQKRISIRPFFAETADNGPTLTALARLAQLAVAAAKLSRDITGYDDDDTTPAAKLTPDDELQHDSFIRDGIKPALLQLGPVTLAPSTEAGKSAGLTFHYSPYAVGPYVEGPYTIFVPWPAFAQYLSDAGKAVFGGMRPKADAEQWQ